MQETSYNVNKLRGVWFHRKIFWSQKMVFVDSFPSKIITNALS